MTQNHIITLIAAAAGSGIILALNESIKEGIKRMFSGLSSRQITGVFILLIGVAFFLISFTGFSLSGDGNNSADVGQQTTTTSPTDAEVYADLAKTGLEKGEDLLAKKRIKDSIELSGREKNWVYQVGIPVSSESEAWDAANSLQGIKNIRIFKESKKSYWIVCDDGYNQKNAEDSLAVFKRKVDSILPGSRVKLIDLMSLCPKRKKLVETNKISKRRKEETYRCVICE